jgi:endonuclease YncB( thermonuclease family)
MSYRAGKRDKSGRLDLVGKEKKKPKKMTAGWLRKAGVKEVLIPGLLLAGVLGWRGWETIGPNYYKNQRVFPGTGVVRIINDGDTFELSNGVRVRMIGIDAPADSIGSSLGLSKFILDKKVWLEYDRYQDDKFGRVLAWVWIGCESNPKFLPADYMHLTYNRSKEGLKENPVGCKKGKLVQEEMVKAGLAKVEVYKDRGELKYEERIK